jgi:uncharacterized membrane protein
VAELLSNGRVIDCILVLMLLEFITLMIVRRQSRRGIPAVQLLFGLGAGAALLLAWRAALHASSWQSICLWLAAAFVVHLIDLTCRWNRRQA